MDFPKITIAPGAASLRRRKGREFSVYLLAYTVAERGPSREIRPGWIGLFGSEAETRAVVSNLRAGRVAGAGGETFSLPQRWPLRWTSQPVPGGLVTVAYLPSLFHLEPTGPPLGSSVRFDFAPPLWWIEAQADGLRADFGDDAPDAARAALFAAFLDRRSPLPLLADLRFQLALFRALRDVDELLLDLSDVPTAARFRQIGLDPPLTVSLEQTQLAEIVIRETTRFHREELRHGQARIAADRRILPFPDPSPRQLRLDFAVA
ncbi:MAG TPA: hypothetical protein VN783_13915 [Thermoanaerobaculia bacterium]|nr:hypothetical protein [Thermoanaerobaculia bacterium]